MRVLAMTMPSCIKNDAAKTVTSFFLGDASRDLCLCTWNPSKFFQLFQRDGPLPVQPHGLAVCPVPNCHLKYEENKGGSNQDSACSQARKHSPSCSSPCLFSSPTGHYPNFMQCVYVLRAALSSFDLPWSLVKSGRQRLYEPHLRHNDIGVSGTLNIED